MPNWCSNSLILRHEDHNQIQSAINAFKTSTFCQNFAPCPQQLRDTVAGYSSDTDTEAARQNIYRRNLDQFGHQNWYSWCIDNWGCKWDIGGGTDGSGGVIHRESEKDVSFSFESAWTPPIKLYPKLEARGFSLVAYYFEPAMMFCGKYADGRVARHDISGDAEWCRKNIPCDILEYMNILGFPF